MARESRTRKQSRAGQILRRMRAAYPDAKCELDWSTPLELAAATILSALCTDKRVNLVTPALFRKYKTAADWAQTPQETQNRPSTNTLPVFSSHARPGQLKWVRQYRHPVHFSGSTRTGRGVGVALSMVMQ